MIDDDFETMVRKMFEQFFESMPFGLETDSTVRFGTSRTQDDEELSVPQAPSEDPHVERIDLDDRVIFILDGIVSDSKPTVRLTRRDVIVSSTDKAEIARLEIPFDADVRESTASFRNSVLEIQLVRAMSRENSSANSVTEIRVS